MPKPLLNLKILFLSILVFGSLPVSKPRAESLLEEKISAIDALVREKIEEEGIPGFSIGIARDGEILWTRGYGLSDLENNVPATPGTVYRTASIGKVLTATAAMKLVEEEKIDLDKPIETYCPQFPEKEWVITTRHLLAHQSGIRHYGGPNDDAENYNLTPYPDIIEPLDQFKNDPLVHPPGDKRTYSTFGFNTLGCVIQGASGKPFLEAMQDLVFDPAGMTHTRGDDPRAIIKNRASGYVREDGVLKNSRYADMSSKMPAGGYVTTVGDLLNFSNALYEGKILKPETIDAMFTNQRLNDGTVTETGLGWGISPPDDLFYGLKEAFHGGGTPTVSGFLYVLPEKDFFTVVFFSNLESIPGRFDLAAKIALIVLELGDTMVQ